MGTLNYAQPTSFEEIEVDDVVENVTEVTPEDVKPTDETEVEVQE